MRSRPRFDRVPLAVRLALALLGCPAIAPGSADAGCGDYVVIRSGGATPADPRAAHPGPLAPCRGPECAGDSSPLTPPIPPPVSLHAGPFDGLPATAEVADRPTPGHSADGPEPLPLAFPSTVFRPPR